jgi:hypothetical protein
MAHGTWYTDPWVWQTSGVTDGHTDPRVDRLLLGVTDHIRGQKMTKKSIVVAPEKFLTVRIMEKSFKSP